jgi:hypothetical protein
MMQIRTISPNLSQTRRMVFSWILMNYAAELHYQQHIRRSLSQIRGLRQWSDWFMN